MKLLYIQSFSNFTEISKMTKKNKNQVLSQKLKCYK